MKACAQYQQDLATAASRSAPLSANAAAHIRDCPACQRAFAELQSAAAIQFENAASLPTPETHPNLHSWVANQITHPGKAPALTWPVLWRPALIAGTALLAVVAFFALPRPSGKTGGEPIPRPQITQLTPPAPQPTLISLRHRIASPAEQILPSENPAGSLTHYRVIDAHTQLQN